MRQGGAGTEGAARKELNMRNWKDGRDGRNGRDGGIRKD